MSTINESSYLYSDFLNEHNMNVESSTVNNLLVNSDLTLSYLNKHSVLITDAYNKVIGKGLTDNQLLVGETGKEPKPKNLLGTTNQVNINFDASNVTLSLPQDIDISSSPHFNGISLSGNLTADSIDTNSIISTGDIKSNTNIVGNQLFATSLTSNRIIGAGTNGLLESLTTTSTNGMTTTVSGSILTIDTPQDLRTTANVEFNNIVGNSFYGVDLNLGRNGGTVELGTYNNGQSYLDLYSDPSMTSHVNFGVVKDASGNNIGPKWHFSSRIASDNDEFRFYRGSGLGGYDYILTFTGSGTNANRITFTRPEESTSTTNGSVVFNGGVGIQKTLNVKDIGCNTINSSTIDTSLLTVTGLTTNKLIGVGTGGALQSLTATSTNGMTTTVSGTTLTINTPQDLRTSSNPLFNNLYVNNINGNKLNLVESSSQITLGNLSEGYTIINSLTGGPGTTYTYTIPTSVASNAYFVMSEGDEVINGHKSFARISTTNISSNMTPLSNNYYDIGSGSLKWKTLYINSIFADNITLNGTALNLSNMVTTNTTQTVSGQKTFTSDVLVGSNNEGMLRLSTYGGGQDRIKGGYINDGNHYLEFYCRSEMVARMSHGYSGSGRDRWFELNGALRFPNGGNSFLNYYQEYSYNTFFRGLNGTISSDIDCTIKCIRIGKNVTLDVNTDTKNFIVTSGNPFLAIWTEIPTQFRPNTYSNGVAIVNNNLSQFVACNVSVNYTGYLTLAPAPNGYFEGINGSTNNLRSFTMTYNIN